MDWLNITDRIPETRNPRVTSIAEAICKTHVNGGMRIGCFSPAIPHQPKAETADSENPSECSIRSLFESNAITDLWPDTAALTSIPPLNLSSYGSYALEGEIIELLLSSGAYRHSELSPVSARTSAASFIDCIAGFDRKHLVGFRTVVPWSNWFYDVAWDHTLVIVDGARSRWWLLCTTDTD
ncbi:MAG: hypothetical protein ACK5N9_03440 [Pirellula sp.]